jgi:hypothetical protein
MRTTIRAMFITLALLAFVPACADAAADQGPLQLPREPVANPGRPDALCAWLAHRERVARRSTLSRSARRLLAENLSQCAPRLTFFAPFQRPL